MANNYDHNMEYKYEPNKTIRPKRFNSIEDNKYLKYKFAKEGRDKAIRRDRWAKLNREAIVDEKFTRNEMWDNYINELKFR
jgi:hypothetical protein